MNAKKAWVIAVLLLTTQYSYAQKKGDFGKLVYNSTSQEKHIYINKIDEGVMAINNEDPTSPQPLGTIQIDGNRELAIHQTTLVANNGNDIVAIDISNLQNPKETSRIRNILPNGNNTPETRISWLPSTRSSAQNISLNISVGAMNGSMSRFVVSRGYLYAIDQHKIHVVSINNGHLEKLNTVNVGSGLETSFISGDRLFLGSENAMYVYSIQNPQQPQFLGRFDHQVGCDPVVVEGNLAYVTIRGGTDCNNNSINELQVIDVSNPNNTRLLTRYGLNAPMGLAVQNSTIYVADGSAGVRVLKYDISRNQIIEHQTAKTNSNAFEVLLTPQSLITVTPSTLIQFNPQRLNELSRIKR